MHNKVYYLLKYVASKCIIKANIPFAFILLIGLSGFLNKVLSQSTPNLPAFYPTAEHSYTTTDGLPDNCIKQVFMDREGRLHIVPCDATAFNQILYEYDGKQAYPTKLKIKPKPIRIYFDGQDSLGRIFGHYYNLELIPSC